MYKFSGYPQSGLSFAEYLRGNFGAKVQVNNTVLLPNLATFLQVAREEELTLTEAQSIQQFKAIAYIFADGSAITA
jgi:hypothetical protein